MNRIRAYQILKISENASETEIRDAYRRLLPENNPEDNPEGFMQLRQAYPVAVLSGSCPCRGRSPFASRVRLGYCSP